MIQAYSLQKDIKLFGQEARNAVQKEMQQHHNMETYIPVDPSKLMYDRNEKPLSRCAILLRSVVCDRRQVNAEGGTCGRNP